MKQKNKFRDCMNKNKIITVKYHNQVVGHLALTSEHLVAFEYDSNWLRNGFSIDLLRKRRRGKDDMEG